MEPIGDIKVNISDLDLNEHVNNVKYTQWILNNIPFENHHQYEIKEYEINFLGETFLNDQIIIDSNLKSLKSNSETPDIYFLGRKKNTKEKVFISKISAVSLS